MRIIRCRSYEPAQAARAIIYHGSAFARSSTQRVAPNVRYAPVLARQRSARCALRVLSAFTNAAKRHRVHAAAHHLSERKCRVKRYGVMLCARATANRSVTAYAPFYPETEDVTVICGIARIIAATPHFLHFRHFSRLPHFDTADAQFSCHFGLILFASSDIDIATPFLHANSRFSFHAGFQRAFAASSRDGGADMSTF